MLPLPFVLLILFILAAISFFFSLSETALIALSKIRLRHMVQKQVKRAKRVQNLVNNLDRFIIAILVGNNFVNIAISAIMTVIFVRVFGYNWGVVIATFVTAFMVLVFCEITPKLLAIKHTEKSALFTAPLMEFIIRLLHPAVVFFQGLSNFILKLFRAAPSKRSPLITEEELRLMIEVGKEEGVLSDQELKMLHRIFEFGEIKLSDVMVPKEEIVAVDISTKPEELLNIFVEEGHARLPVYRGKIDNIIGVIFARDLLYVLKDKGLFVLEDLLQGIYKAPGTFKVHDLLQKFQAEKIQIAVVVDENGVTCGLVTLEDLVEEIVGEIEEDTRRKNSFSPSL
ncbi:MAG: hemolysin family protein [Candidatus Omnitrophota bacterium]